MAKKKENKLSLKEELFCQCYARSGDTFGNGRMSYARAFNKLAITSKQKHVCDVLVQRLLSKVVVYKRCDELLNEKIDDEIVDKELARVVQQNENLHAKVSAISEYNKVRGRITQKIRHKFEGVDTESLKQTLAERIAGGS